MPRWAATWICASAGVVRDQTEKNPPMPYMPGRQGMDADAGQIGTSCLDGASAHWQDGPIDLIVEPTARRAMGVWRIRLRHSASTGLLRRACGELGGKCARRPIRPMLAEGRGRRDGCMKAAGAVARPITFITADGGRLEARGGRSSRPGHASMPRGFGRRLRQ